MAHLKMPALIVLVLVAALYGWATRTGRYQIVRPDSGLTVFLDTSTGERWLLTGQVTDQGRMTFNVRAGSAG